MPDPRDLVAPVDEGAEVAPPTPLPDDEEQQERERERGRAGRSDAQEQGDSDRVDGHRPFTGEIPHATEPDEPPRR